MRLLVIDRDRVNAQLIEQRLETFGHQIVFEPAKNEALEKLIHEDFDAVLLDPAPLNSARPFVISLRRALPRKFIYIMLMAYEGSRTDAISNGMNDALPKPLDPDRLPVSVDNARRMLELIQRLADEGVDYPNMGGVLGKSAMNQLFLTSLDRADRYGEQSFMLFISIRNIAGLRGAVGEDGCEEIVVGLGSYLGKMRRQSDITGRVGPAEYGSLILRPVRETEPQDAAARFKDILSRDRSSLGLEGNLPDLEVRLVHIPTGETVVKYDIP